MALAAALLVWALSYVVVWLDRSGCAVAWTASCTAAFPKWYADAVTLEWVDKAQTLLAGILAVGAGATVLLATKMSLDDAKLTATRSRNAELRAAMTQMRTSFLFCAAMIARQEYEERFSPLPIVQVLAPQLAKVDTRTAEALLMSALYVDQVIRLQGNAPSDDECAHAHCLVLGAYLANPSRFFLTRGLFKARRLTRAQIVEHLQGQGFAADVVDRLFGIKPILDGA